MGQGAGFVAGNGDSRGFRGRFGERVYGRVGSSAMGQRQVRNGAFETSGFRERWGTALLEMGHFPPRGRTGPDEQAGRTGG